LSVKTFATARQVEQASDLAAAHERQSSAGAAEPGDRQVGVFRERLSIVALRQYVVRGFDDSERER
jgi:hypothetical protein